MKKILLLITIGIFSSCEFKVQSGKIADNSLKKESSEIQIKFPEKNGFVNDFENVFTSEQINILEKTVNDYENKLGREIYIITTANTYGFENYDKLMSAFFQNWNVGKLPEQNGLIILMSKENRKFAITAGLEAQNYLTDEKINEVIGMNIIPKLKKNDFYAGTKSAVEEMIKMWK